MNRTLEEAVHLWVRKKVDAAGSVSAFARMVAPVAEKRGVKGLQRQRINAMVKGHQSPLAEHLDVMAEACGLDVPGMLAELLRLSIEGDNDTAAPTR